MKTIKANDPLQPGYQYPLAAREGELEFSSDLTPKQMLDLGVFGAHYFEGYGSEFPTDWFSDARVSVVHDFHQNYFNVDASQTREEWEKKGWIYPEDPRGWFQWYCRYYLGRRIPDEDERQIKRWKAMSRHVAQVQGYCRAGDETCRPRQRQALLHWAYDSRKL